jgi:hypothetical protein
MAHYATINEQNQVIAVNTGVDEDVTQLDENGNEVGGSSEAWENFYTEQLANPNLKVKRCSYNSSIRGKYPSIGDLYDSTLDEFVSTIEESLENES